MSTPQTNALVERLCAGGYIDANFTTEAIKLLRELECQAANLKADADRLAKLDNRLADGDRLEIWIEDGGVIISQNGQMIIEPEESLRAAIDAIKEGA